jgi:hypothetical protein
MTLWCYVYNYEYAYDECIIKNPSIPHLYLSSA